MRKRCRRFDHICLLFGPFHARNKANIHTSRRLMKVDDQCSSLLIFMLCSFHIHNPNHISSYASMSIWKRSQRNFFCRVSNFLVSMQMTCSKSGVLWHRVRRSNQVLFCGHTQTSSFPTSTATNQLPPTSISDVKWIFDCSFDVYWKDYWKY